MSYDLVVKNGMVIDGSGGARYRGDIGVKDGKITTIGRITAPADQVVDAEGHVVTPGFVDGHTHMDAQIFWDSLGSCSCYHGVTSVVMGNCGFTLAPCREEEVDYVFRNLERAEDISRDAMLAGITWQWETYPEYLDVIDKLPKGMNYAGYVGHSALRTYVMGERAFDEQASEDDLAKMVANVQDAVRAGAIGFSTSRSPAHLTPDDRPVASRTADFSEVAAIVNGMGDLNAGIFQLAMERGTNEELAVFYQKLMDLSKESGRPVTFGSLNRRSNPGAWKALYEIIEQGNLDGANCFTQVHSREINVVLSFETQLPFDDWPVWRDIRKRPLAEQRAALRDPETKRPVEYYVRLPDEKDRLFILVDPMLATGYSASYAVDVLNKHGVPDSRIRFMAMVAAPEGMRAFNEAHPTVEVWAAALDEKLNEKAYIVPGLGDAGDRMFGTK